MRGKYLVLLAVALSSVYLANAKCCARGVWSSWAPSGSCSDSCGSCGKITYTRKCISARNGCPCSGPVRKTKHCNIMPCKYPRESCCGKMDAIVTRGKVICGPQPADRPEASGPAPGTPCSAPPRPPPPPRPRTTKRITKATTNAGPGGPPASVTPGCGPPLAEGSTTATPTQPCPDGWSYCPGSSQCYKWIDGELTQPDAKEKCEELGGNLAIIDSSAATQCVLDIATNSSQEASSAWIGLVDIAENSNHTADCTCWKWHDGSPYNYENFAPGQPNNAEEKEWCSEVFLPASNYPAGTWNDELCEEYTRPAVCSVRANPTAATSEPTPTGAFKPSTPLALTASTKPSQSVASTATLATTTKKPPCPTGWAYCPAASRCYKLVDGGYTQPEAQSKCRELGGNLAIVDSSAATQCLLDNAAKSSQEATSAWIGLVDKAENSNHTANCTCWKWLDGLPYTYENFAPGQPNNAEGKEWCSEVFLPASNYPAGTWNDELCEGYRRPALCSVPANKPDDPHQTTEVPTRATGGLTTSTPSKITPPSSSTSGSSKPSTPLASSTSARSTPSSAKASTPAASTAEPPCPCEEDSTPAGSSTSTGPTPSTASTTASTTSTKTSPCPDGWRYCPGAARCYKLVDGGYTQPEAQSQCRALGGNLATIESAAATQCLLDYGAQTSAWIGLVDPTENAKHAANCTCWKWLDGSPFNYENFEPREPNNVGGKEWCNIVDLSQSSTSAGTWLDWNCGDLTVPALCSVPANGTKDTPTREPTRAAAKTTTRESSKPSTTPATPIPSVTSKLSTRRASPTTAETSKPSTPPASPTSAGPARLTTKSVTRASTKKAGPCPDDWAHCPGASQCYKFVNGEFTQPEAQAHCRAIGADLATVKSVEATQCIFDYATTTSQAASSAWIGLVDKAENSNHTADCTCWKWLDGSPYNYENFAEGQPNNGEWKEWCTEVYLRTAIWQTTNYPVGTWNDELCTYKRPALCAVPADGSNNEHKSTAAPTRTATQSTTSGPFMPSTRPASPTAAATSKQSSQRPSTKPTAPPPSTSTKTAVTTTKKPPCPAGWGYCPGASHCYKLVDGGYTQPEGQSQCRALGGNLATVDSAAANQCVLEYASKSSQTGTTSAWIGLVDKTENSKHTATCACWTWLDGSPFKYENFAPAGSAGFAKGQPNNQEGKEWCSEIFLPGSKYPAGTWNDELCNGYKRPALCSVRAK